MLKHLIAAVMALSIVSPVCAQSQWVVKEVTQPSTGISGGIATLESSLKGASITLKCFEGEPATMTFTLHSDTYLGGVVNPFRPIYLSLSDSTAPTLFSIEALYGDNAAITSLLAPAEKNQNVVLFLIGADRTGDSVIFSATDISSEAHSFIFNPSGAENAIRSVVNSCNHREWKQVFGRVDGRSAN